MIYYSFIYGVSDTDDPQLDPPTIDWGPNSTLDAICFKHAPLKSAGGHWPVRVATPWLLGHVLIIYEAPTPRVRREVVNSAVRCEAICIIHGASIRANPICLQKFGWYITWLSSATILKVYLRGSPIDIQTYQHCHPQGALSAGVLDYSS